MRCQQGTQDPQVWTASFAAGPRERGDREPTSRDGRDDADDGGGFEYEDDRFSTNHDDQAGVRWRINNDVDADDRDSPRGRTRDTTDEDATERGVFRTRADGEPPVERERDRCGAEEARDTWRPARRGSDPSHPPRRFDVRDEQRRGGGPDDHRHFVQHAEQRRFEQRGSDDARARPPSRSSRGN